MSSNNESIEEKVPFGKFGFIIHSGAQGQFQRHWVTIVGVGVVVFVVGLWSIYQWNSGSSKDYLTAETIFNEWKGDRNEHLTQLQKILKHHPELHAKYDGRIAQKLLLKSQQGLATLFSKAALKRVGELSPYYAQYSKNSLLIGEKKFQMALIASKELKQALDQDVKFWEIRSSLVQHGDILYGYNLLRIAFLEQMLGHSEAELEAWKEFKRKAGWLDSTISPPSSSSAAYQQIDQNFRKNDISLRDFIQYRELVLEKLIPNDHNSISPEFDSRFS